MFVPSELTRSPDHTQLAVRIEALYKALSTAARVCLGAGSEAANPLLYSLISSRPRSPLPPLLPFPHPISTMPPPPKQDPPLRLTLTANSIRNTTIAVEDDSFYYEVVTRFWHPNITKIKKLDSEQRELETIAEIEREPGKQPRIRFGEGEWMDVNKYITWADRGM